MDLGSFFGGPCMLDFKSYINNLLCTYLVIEHHMLQIQGIPLQYFKINYWICPLQIFIFLVDSSGHLYQLQTSHCRVKAFLFFIS